MFILNYKKGFNNIFKSDVDYDLLQLGTRYTFDVGARGTVHIAMEAGRFDQLDKGIAMPATHAGLWHTAIPEPTKSAIAEVLQRHSRCLSIVRCNLRELVIGQIDAGYVNYRKSRILKRAQHPLRADPGNDAMSLPTLRYVQILILTSGLKR